MQSLIISLHKIPFLFHYRQMLRALNVAVKACFCAPSTESTTGSHNGVIKGWQFCSNAFKSSPYGIVLSWGSATAAFLVLYLLWKYCNPEFSGFWLKGLLPVFLLSLFSDLEIQLTPLDECLYMWLYIMSRNFFLKDTF